jgi:hypothetical protein
MDTKEDSKSCDSCDEEKGSAGDTGNPEVGMDTGKAPEARGMPLVLSAPTKEQKKQIRVLRALAKGQRVCSPGLFQARCPFPMDTTRRQICIPAYIWDRLVIHRGRCRATGCLRVMGPSRPICSRVKAYSSQEDGRRRVELTPAMAGASSHRARPEAQFKLLIPEAQGCRTHPWAAERRLIRVRFSSTTPRQA